MTPNAEKQQLPAARAATLRLVIGGAHLPWSLMAIRHSTWVAAARALRDKAMELIGQHDGVRLRWELAELLERAEAGEKVDIKIQQLLYPHKELRRWVAEFFSPRLPDWPVAMPERGLAPRGPAPLGSGRLRERDAVIVPVLYGTDRRATNGSYSAGPGELSVGVAHVSIPHDHRMGDLEFPKWWKQEFRPDPEMHVVLLSVDVLDRHAWIARAASAVKGSPARDALIFIHGYGISFEDAACGAAQIAYDLAFPGAPLLYSWPSASDIPRYKRDENNARWTVTHFTDFLRLALTEIEARAVHVVAHGMGNRPLMEALRTLGADSLPAGTAELSQVIFAAPDIDAAIFRDLAREFRQAARRFTLYASSRDKALLFSKSMNEYPRAGDAGLNLVLTEGIDTIDASFVDTCMGGHFYVGDGDSILGDIYELVRGGHPPDDRSFRLRRRERDGYPYWQF
jgi:esterase/lipase superfamily enzyme